MTPRKAPPSTPAGSDRSLRDARSRFTYRVVTSNGAGIHGREFARCSDAKATAQQLAERDREQKVKFGPFEIERVENLGSGHRYWMRKRSRWVLWNPHEDYETRSPDWIYA